MALSPKILEMEIYHLPEIVKVACRAGWPVPERLTMHMAAVPPLTAHQKDLIGASGTGTAFGGRFLVSDHREVEVADQWTKYRNGGYRGHCCNLYYLPEIGRIFARCFNGNFMCPLGELSRKAFERGDLSMLPEVA